MENEEKKDIRTTPEEIAELAAKKLRDKSDLRAFGIAIMAAVIVVAFYHLGRLSVRSYLKRKNPPRIIKSCHCRPGRPFRKGKKGPGAPKQLPPKPQAAKPQTAPKPAAPAAPAATKPAPAPAAK